MSPSSTSFVTTTTTLIVHLQRHSIPYLRVSPSPYHRMNPCCLNQIQTRFLRALQSLLCFDPGVSLTPELPRLVSVA
jgi:hypothetical protein